MHSRLRLLVVTALLSLAAGCGILVTEPIPYGTIRAEARSRTGAPLPGIVVELYIGPYSLQYERTDDSGRVVFRRVPVGQYGVSMRIGPELADLSEILDTAPRTYVDGLDITPGMDTTLRFTFAKRGAGSIEAVVQSQTNRRLPGQLVYFYGSAGVIGSAATDATGLARLDSVPFGQYGAFTVPPDSLGVANQPALFADRLGVDAEFVPRASFTVQTCVGTIAPQALDQDDRAIPDVPIYLYSAAGILRSAQTNVNGIATFTNVRCDNYGVFILPGIPGYDVRFEPGYSVADGLLIAPDTVLTPRLRATRLP